MSAASCVVPLLGGHRPPLHERSRRTPVTRPLFPTRDAFCVGGRVATRETAILQAHPERSLHPVSGEWRHGSAGLTTSKAASILIVAAGLPRQSSLQGSSGPRGEARGWRAGGGPGRRG